MHKNRSLRWLFVAVVLAMLVVPTTSFAGVFVSVGFAPPAIPVYVQPVCPAAGYLWTPGYWGYNPAGGYYWIPGTWIQPPVVGVLWTPGYWGWSGGGFGFNAGFWGASVGFYGGINYGFGYGGVGYGGGRWNGNQFSYNTTVNNVNTTIIHNTYVQNVTTVNNSHTSYNGGEGGVTAKPTPEEMKANSQKKYQPTGAQNTQMSAAAKNPALRASVNGGKPSIAATQKPGDFKTNVVPAKEAGAGEWKPPANAPKSQQPNNMAGKPAANMNKSAASTMNGGKTLPKNTGTTGNKPGMPPRAGTVPARNTTTNKAPMGAPKSTPMATPKANPAPEHAAPEHAAPAEHAAPEHAAPAMHTAPAPQHAAPAMQHAPAPQQHAAPAPKGNERK
jgi:hypothetical protein